MFLILTLHYCSYQEFKANEYIDKKPTQKKLLKSVSVEPALTSNLQALDSEILGFKNDQVFESCIKGKNNKKISFNNFYA